jgi:capsular polysaccharide biosynthesis protein/Mrp family chromosome partitioning ATPase
VTPDTRSDAPTLTDYARVLRRRVWAIAAVVGLTLLLALAYDLTSTPLYRASSEVLLSRDSPAAKLTGAADEDTRGDPERFVQTQFQIARTHKLAKRVLIDAGVPDRKTRDLLAATKVVAPGASDVLEFEVRDPSAPLATRLARSYAAQFATYQRRLDKASLDRALSDVEARIAGLREELSLDAGETPPSVADPEVADETSLYKALVEKKLQLQTLAPLEAGRTVVLSASDEPAKIRPRPKRDLSVALALGLLLGVVLAFALEALDRRLDSVRAVAGVLGIPLLGQIRLQRHMRRRLPVRVMPSQDASPAEGFQVLRANFEAALDAVGLSAPGTVVLATSATKKDGQARVMAGLSVALARSGKRVILVDLEPSSSLHHRFDVPTGPGAFDVATGETSLDDALIPFDGEGAGVRLLPLGATPGLMERLLSAPEGDELIAELRARTDLVLVSAPPLLTRASVRGIAAAVEAVFVVVNADGARERMLRRLRSDLELLAPEKLGFVATGTEIEPLATSDGGRVVPIAGSSFLPASGSSVELADDHPRHGTSRGRQRAKK